MATGELNFPLTLCLEPPFWLVAGKGGLSIDLGSTDPHPWSAFWGKYPRRPHGGSLAQTKAHWSQDRSTQCCSQQRTVAQSPVFLQPPGRPARWGVLLGNRVSQVKAVPAPVC